MTGTYDNCSTRRAAIYRGIICGLQAWGAYAVVECLFRTVLPWIIPEYRRDPPEHWGFTGILFSFYVVAGVALGSLSGWGVYAAFRRFAFLTQVRIESLLGAVNTFTVVLALSTNFIVNYKFGLSLLGLLTTRTGSFGNKPLGALGFAALAIVALLGWNWWLNQQQYHVIGDLEPAAASHGPNIVLITMDTVRADHLSLYGYDRDTTPGLRNLAETATIYNRAIASGPWTLPSHASMFTGMYSSTHGAHGYRDRPGPPLSLDFDTLAEVLAGAGLATIGVVSNLVLLTHSHQLNQGFEYWDERRPTPLTPAPPRTFTLQKATHTLISHVLPPPAIRVEFRDAKTVSNAALTILERLRVQQSRFFLFVNYMDAHWPYIPPPPYDTMFPTKDETFTDSQYYALSADTMKLERTPSIRERLHLLSQYDGGIAYIDAQIARLVTRLKEMTLFDNSLIIITSDHGEAFGERNLLGHASSVYQDQIHIPLLIKFPYQHAGRVVEEFVSVVDLMPTVLEMLNIPAPDGVQGKSLLTPGDLSSRIVITQSFPLHFRKGQHPRLDSVHHAVFLDSMKLIESTTGKREFYDLSNDPNESSDLYDPANKQATMLKKKLDSWLSTSERRKTKGAVKLDKQTLDRLRSLGYIQ